MSTPIRINDRDYTPAEFAAATGLRVGGWLSLQGCTALTSLPADLRVGEWLDLQSCTALRELPADLRVDGVLHLRGCTALRQLPVNLKVGTYLFLSSDALPWVPESVVIGGGIRIDGVPVTLAEYEALTVDAKLRFAKTLYLREGKL